MSGKGTKIFRQTILFGAIYSVFIIVPFHVNAGELVYRPANPSFAGGPLSSSHLLSLAEAQKPEFSDGINDNSTSITNAERFISNLESRLLSSLSSQVNDAIFGSNPKDSGTIVFGDTKVSFNRGLETISLTITDAVSGTTTIQVPILQVN